MKPAHIKTAAESVLFKSIAPERAAALLCECAPEVRQYKKGEVIYTKDGFSRSLGILLTGSARVEKQSGGKTVIINTLGKGAVFGMAALFFEDETFPTTLTAQKDSAILFITKQQLTALFAKEPLLCENYITLLSERIHFLNKKIEALASGSQFGKLYGFIISEYKKRGENGAVTLPYNMQELAQALGVSRSSLYRELDSLTEQGVIVKKGKTFILNKTEDLL